MHKNACIRHPRQVYSGALSKNVVGRDLHLRPINLVIYAIRDGRIENDNLVSAALDRSDDLGRIPSDQDLIGRWQAAWPSVSARHQAGGPSTRLTILG